MIKSIKKNQQPHLQKNRKASKQFFDSGILKNRKAQGLSTNAMILIILGVVVLVVLILGFTLGWKKLVPWLSTNNVDTIVNACNAACSTNSQYDFCSFERELRDEKGKEYKGNCNTFATEILYKIYGIKECPELCPVIPETP